MQTDKEPTLTFVRSWDIILHNQKLTSGEKLVLCEICRFWPKPYHGSNSMISHNTGLCVRQVQYCLKSLSTGPAKRGDQGHAPRRAYITRGYVHCRIKGRTYTSRLIVPICLPGKGLPPEPLGKKDFSWRADP